MTELEHVVGLRKSDGTAYKFTDDPLTRMPTVCVAERTHPNLTAEQFDEIVDGPVRDGGAVRVEPDRNPARWS
jgi:hypothetical protein